MLHDFLNIILFVFPAKEKDVMTWFMLEWQPITIAGFRAIYQIMCPGGCIEIAGVPFKVLQVSMWVCTLPITVQTASWGENINQKLEDIPTPLQVLIICCQKIAQISSCNPFYPHGHALGCISGSPGHEYIKFDGYLFTLPFSISSYGPALLPRVKWQWRKSPFVLHINFMPNVAPSSMISFRNLNTWH